MYILHLALKTHVLNRFGVFRDVGEGQRKREGGVRAVGRHHLRQDVGEFRRGAVVGRRKQSTAAAADGEHQQQPVVVVRVLMRDAPTPPLCFIRRHHRAAVQRSVARLCHRRCCRYCPDRRVRTSPRNRDVTAAAAAADLHHYVIGNGN